jgi:L-Ala-D/L-Glu epimerase
MRIARIETFPVRIPLKPERLMITALGRHEISDYLLVRLSTNDGLEGAGEATVSPRWSGETVWGAKAVIDEVLAPAIAPCNPADIEEIDRRMDERCVLNPFAKAALEMACWDVAGKAAGKPVYELLGGACRSRTIRSRFSLAAYEPEQARRRAAELIAAGFTTIKVKVGLEAESDIERVRAVRETIGPEPDVMIDANGGWDAATAIRCVRALEDCRLSLVEQPTPPGDYAAMAQVRRETGCKILADESCFDLVQARELIRNHCCDVISLYPGKNGGIRKAREIAHFAQEHGVACSIGSNLEWDPATAAMAHLAVATPNVQIERYPGDMLGPDYHERSVAREPLAIAGPLTTLPARPGLGIEVDWELVRRYALADAR